MRSAPLEAPVRVGLVGTGYAAKLRAETFALDPRSQVVAVAGHQPATTRAFADSFNLEPLSAWEDLVRHPQVDLVVVATVNALHGPVIQAALSAGKHVVVEYPLALDLAQAYALVTLAEQQHRLLHVEHIELLGGVHQALVSHLGEIGPVRSACYRTVAPQAPAPRRWTYHRELFGFPLLAGVSRIHRLTHALGPVVAVSCQLEYQGDQDPYFCTCICQAQLTFASGATGEVFYAKGEGVGPAERLLEVQGAEGRLVFDGDEGHCQRGENKQPLTVSPRRGLFAQDTTMVLDHLTAGTPLYVTLAGSLAAHRVADGARQAASSGGLVYL